MAEEKSRTTKTLVLAAVAICWIVGGIAAYSVVSEPIAYIASMSHGITVLFLLLPAVLILFCLGIGGLALQKSRFAAVSFVSCLALPGSYFGVLKSAEVLGLAQYKDNPINEMRPIGSELKERIVIVFEKEATQDQIHAFDENVLRKKIPQPNGVVLEFADGICNFSYPQVIPKRTVIDIPFCTDATEEQKSKIRTEVIASPLIEIAFEDIESGRVKKLK
jgi:hypothetical protein